MTIFDFRHASIKKKISGLFIVLLAFLLCVITYSAYKLKTLEADMKEVAYLDIPLNQIVTQIQFIELEQHLQVEEYELEKEQKINDLKPHQELVLQKRKLKRLLDKAIGLLETGLNHKTIILAKDDHEKVLLQLERYRTESERYEQELDHIYRQNSINRNDMDNAERLALNLEQEEKSLVTLLNNLEIEDSYFTEKHEEDFFIINSILGICALILGLFLTVYIIQVIMSRVYNIRGQIKSFDDSLQIEGLSHSDKVITTSDELEELEHDIQTLMLNLTKEIKNREHVEQQLLQLATRDKLTGLLNRHKWDEQIETHIKLAQRGYPFGLILLDIDYFKKVNDQYGHPTGDKILKALADELTAQLRDIDLIFRMGGEEFAIICPMKDSAYTQKVASEIRSHIEDINAEGLPKITISLGVATYQDSDNAATLFKRADVALYKAKAQGRNQVICEE